MLLFAEAGDWHVPVFLRENWLLLVPSALAFVGLYLLLPQARRIKPIWGGVVAAMGLS